MAIFCLLVDKNHHIMLANKTVEFELKLGPEDIIGEYCPRVVHGVRRVKPNLAISPAKDSPKPAGRR